MSLSSVYRAPARLHALPRCAPQPRLLPSRPCRRYATATEASPPPPPKESPAVETFSEASKPREYHSRPQPRDLPPLRRTWPTVAVLSLVGVGAWVLFLTYTANQERLSSSVMQRVLASVRASPELRDVLGEAIRPVPEWWLNGDPWVHGEIRLMQGNVDLSFRVKGSKDSGTLYFTSIRKAKGEPFTVLRFRVIADDGTVVNVS
ncbi:DUF1783-domain-containing protein [Obba rivulosa]|uniref:DUF1783-domain-containing protein n=1 Tax=Obba rivulosa TaxID=1052685 RepID=A0A8E2DQI0_9APHY|nr:DUF1783-domain-containing protein [Obba rivulosa]